MRQLGLISSALSLALFLSIGPTHAQETEDEDAASSQSSNRPIEEIVVFSQRSFFELKHEIWNAEKNIFRLFNDNNSSDRMDIVCSSEVILGSLISQRNCEPVFLKQMRTRNAQASRMGFAELLNHFELLAEVRSDMGQLKTEIDGLIATNKEYADALADYARMVDDYSELHAIAFEKD